MRYRYATWMSVFSCVLLLAAGCGLGQLSSQQALDAIRKTEFFQKPQEGGFRLHALEVTEIQSLDKTTSAVQFRWAAEAPDDPECRLERSSRIQFQRLDSGWQFDVGQLVSTLETVIQSAVNPRSAEKTMKLIGMSEGDFSARKGRYASLTELMDANILPQGLAPSDAGFESSGYFFKFTSSPNKFSLSSRSLIITDSVPAYYTDHTGGMRFSTQGPATAESPVKP
jgi:hypothetical protein